MLSKTDNNSVPVFEVLVFHTSRVLQYTKKLVIIIYSSFYHVHTLVHLRNKQNQLKNLEIYVDRFYDKLFFSYPRIVRFS